MLWQQMKMKQAETNHMWHDKEFEVIHKRIENFRRILSQRRDYRDHICLLGRYARTTVEAGTEYVERGDRSTSQRIGGGPGEGDTSKNQHSGPRHSGGSKAWGKRHLEDGLNERGEEGLEVQNDIQVPGFGARQIKVPFIHKRNPEKGRGFRKRQ